MPISHARILALCNAYLRLRTNYHEAHDETARLVKSVRAGEISYPVFVQRISDNFLFANESAEDMGLVMEEKGRYNATSHRLNSEARRQRNIRARRAGEPEEGIEPPRDDYVYAAPGTDPFAEPQGSPGPILPAKTLENIAKYIEQRKEEPSRVTFEGEKLPGQGDEYRKSGLV